MPIKTKMNKLMLCALTIFCGCSKPSVAEDPVNSDGSLSGKHMAVAALKFVLF
ncbi:hypothetical protein FHT21_002285 [Pedobacter sp. SG908]|nr:hypothetical protein [Pedobacter sp. SG908]